MMGVPPVVDAEWYREHAAEVILADVRWYSDGRDGHQAYAAAHIPGAVWISIDDDLAAPATEADGRHPLPTPEHFAEALGRRGLADDVTVVAYDDASGSIAARLVWLLRVLGQPAAVLNGGLGTWSGELESGVVERAPVVRRVRPWPQDRFITADAVDGGAETDVLIDARAHDRYTGEVESPLDPRAGHIPGAANVPWAANLDDDGFFAPSAELAELYGSRGVDRSSRVVAYCGSGVTACTDLIALERAGFTNTRLYPGSWSQWAADARRPIETGATSDG
ncbi:sulfurtransferase [Curtobacterium ammoniigenes]|uniref:sulfurtransferase n=1 Tax=Curtobacterium ammoniigenes TaxID=395387 RepID=UPI00082BA536|nr:sulfurtransferase [Curtobacterium ammoniigenes]